MKNTSAIHETNSIFSTDKRLLFVLLCLIAALLLYIKKTFIENQTAAFEFLMDRPEGTILQMISALQFFSIPLIYFWKFTIIALVIWIGCFLFGYRVTYIQCWSVVITSELIFLVPEVLKIAWFLVINTDPTIYDIRAFYPFSLMHFFNYYELDKRWAYPLRAFNVFEVAYWFILVSGIHYFTKKSKQYVWIIVACSYILLFLLWLWFYVIVYK